MTKMTETGNRRKASGLKNNSRPDRGANRKHGMIEVLSPAEERDRLAKQLRIKPKTKAFIDKLLDDPKISQTQAWLDTHGTTNRASARVTSSKVLAKANVQGYRDSAVSKAKSKIVELVDSSNENTALKASQDILDRTEGKAIQKTENTTRTLEVKLDLSGVRIGAHHVQALPESE